MSNKSHGCFNMHCNNFTVCHTCDSDLLNFVCDITCSQLVSLPSQNSRAVCGPPVRSSMGGGVSVGGSEGWAKRSSEGRADDVRRSTEGRGRSVEEMQLSNFLEHRLQL